MIYGEKIILQKSITENSRLDSGSEGEKQFVRAFLNTEFKNQHYLVCMPHFGGTNPDFLICSPEIGFLICEVKNVKLHNLNRIEPNGSLFYNNDQSTNPWRQAKWHRDECSDYLQSSYREDFYLDVKYCVIFTSITKTSFLKKFREQIAVWSTDQKDKFFKRFKFLDEIQNYYCWHYISEYQKERLLMFDFEQFCRTVTPDFIGSPNPRLNLFLDSTMLERRISIINSLQFIPENLSDLWNEYTIICDSFRYKRYYSLRVQALTSLKRSAERIQSDLKTEIIKEQKYLSELQALEREISKHSLILTENYCTQISNRLDNLFEIRKKRLINYVTEQYKWHNSITENVIQGFMDIAKVGSKIVNKIRPTEKTEVFEKKIEEIDIRTNIQKKFDLYTNEQILLKQIKRIVDDCLETYLKDWGQYLEEKCLVNSHNLNPNDPDYQFSGDIGKMSKELTDSQLAFMSGLSTTAMATVGLAAGWHTMAYAISSVVPAGLVMTASITLVSALSSKEKKITSIKNDISNLIENYRYVVRESVLDNKSKNNLTIRECFTQTGEEIKKQIIESFDIDSPRIRIHDFDMIIQVLQNEIYEIDQFLLNE
ncbi:hypothetical protein P7H59_04050 [Enterococcus viikkiensis]|uniref:NERD domain-containing protein n=1 Tax=Enterococcus viikkiensis TaxID=930854 RepID=A0ABU3FNU1_9ENTE|nr:hypothetical protein [Enterococcus viikkiensis]MDT2827625.1 hypothetical protein [Enterococcus viikkiensis]